MTDITKADIIELRDNLANAEFYAFPDNLFESHDADLYRVMLTALPALLDAAEERDQLKAWLEEAEREAALYKRMVEKIAISGYTP